MAQVASAAEFHPPIDRLAGVREPKSQLAVRLDPAAAIVVAIVDDFTGAIEEGQQRSTVCEPKSISTPPPADSFFMFARVAAGQS